MKGKLLQIRADTELLSMIEYLQKINGYKNTSDTVRKTITKEWVKEYRVKRGRWILTADDEYEYCTCSNCGYQNGENWMIGSAIPFCQMCGAKMD